MPGRAGVIDRLSHHLDPGFEGDEVFSPRALYILL